ncbi:MAG: hypothetical protein U9R53_11100 [Chloroflexota bacterium]|nr:hypothetical protein [Chloroflexota bacterium]
MDEDFEVMSIHKAERSKVELALAEPCSKARNLRGQLSIKKFITISNEIWNREKGHIKQWVEDPNFRDKSK